MINKLDIEAEVPVSDFSLEQLQSFLAVVDYGSFSEAARIQNRAQSAVSNAVQKLEEKLGTQLFDRSEYRPRLSDAGRALLPQARRIAEDVAAFRLQAQGIAGDVESELTIAIDGLCSTRRMATALQPLQERFPALLLRCYSRMLDDVLSLLADGVADIGILSLYGSAPPTLERVPLFTMNLHMVAAPHHPLARHGAAIPPHLLRRYSQLVLVDSSGLAGARDYGVYASTTWRFEKIEHMLPLLEQGIGYGIMPDHVVDAHLAAGTLVQLTPESWEGDRSGILLPVHAVWHSDRKLGPAGQWLINTLRKSGQTL